MITPWLLYTGAKGSRGVTYCGASPDNCSLAVRRSICPAQFQEAAAMADDEADTAGLLCGEPDDVDSSSEQPADEIPVIISSAATSSRPDLVSPVLNATPVRKDTVGAMLSLPRRRTSRTPAQIRKNLTRRVYVLRIAC